jgi:hypothetical protein
MKSYIYNDTSMDIERLEGFIDGFWREIMSPLDPNQHISVSLNLLFYEYTWSGKPIMLKNNLQSFYLLRSKILSGSLASYIRIHEDIDNVKCYFQYIIIPIPHSTAQS